MQIFLISLRKSYFLVMKPRNQLGKKPLWTMSGSWVSMNHFEVSSLNLPSVPSVTESWCGSCCSIFTLPYLKATQTSSEDYWPSCPNGRSETLLKQSNLLIFQEELTRYYKQLNVVMKCWCSRKKPGYSSYSVKIFLNQYSATFINIKCCLSTNCNYWI